MPAYRFNPYLGFVRKYSMMPAIGYALREQNRDLLTDEHAVNAAEITFERADDPLRTERYLGSATFDYVSVHALKLSPGSAEPPARRYLEAVREIALENGATSISDHLGFTRGGHDGVEMEHFAPVPFTLGALEATCRNVELIQRYFTQHHFYLENIAYLFRFEGEMGEGDFLSRVLSRTGCGWLLDVTNVYANAVNFHFDPYEFISSVVPDAARVQMHLAGGFFDGKLGTYIDSHSHAVPDEVWKLYRFALEQAGPKVAAVFVERDQNFPNQAGWRDEIRRAREIAAQVSVEQAVLQRVG
jgi:uncharacterized protein (UPF0276 family)